MHSPDSKPSETRTLIWMCVVIGVSQLGFGAVIPVLPLYARSYGVSVSAIGATIAAFGLARFAAAMPSGRLSDRIGRRPTLALGGLVGVAGNLLSGASTTYGELLLGRFVAGLGAGIVITIGIVILADISQPSRRGRMMAIYQSTFLFAVGAGPYPGGLLAEHFGLAMPFYANAAAALAVGAIAWFAVPETRDPRRARESGAAAVPVAYLGQVRLMLAKRGFLLVCLVGFTHAVVRTGGLFNVVPLVGAQQLALTAGQIGTGLALGSLLGLAFAYPSGVMADRYGRKPVIVTSALITGAAFFGFWFAGSYAAFLVACLVWGVAAAVSGAAPSAYAADSAPPDMNAAALSSFRALADVGYVVGPIGLGLLTDASGPYTTLMFCSVAITLAALAFARHAPETYRRRRRE